MILALTSQSWEEWHDQSRAWEAGSKKPSCRVVAVDGGPGFARDSLLPPVLYNEKDSPMQLGIFGPEAHFGHSILTGDIAIARE